MSAVLAGDVPVRIAVEGLRFLLELTCLAVLGVAGWRVADTVLLRGALALALPAAGVAWWGLLVAPRARNRLRDPARLAAEVVFFAAAGIGLATVAGPAWGVGLTVVAVADALVLRRYPEREPGGGVP